MTPWHRRDTRLTTRQDPGRLSPRVCNSLRMASRAVPQLYEDVLQPSGLRVTQFRILATLAIDQTALTRRANLLEGMV